MKPKVYARDDYTLFLYEDIEKPFIIHIRHLNIPGYDYKQHGELDIRPTNVIGIKIMLSDKEEGAVDVQDSYGRVTIKYSHDWPPVIVEAVKILTDEIMRRELLEKDT